MSHTVCHDTQNSDQTPPPFTNREILSAFQIECMAGMVVLLLCFMFTNLLRLYVYTTRLAHNTLLLALCGLSELRMWYMQLSETDSCILVFVIFSSIDWCATSETTTRVKAMLSGTALALALIPHALQMMANGYTLLNLVIGDLSRQKQDAPPPASATTAF